jgi:hypothetical protein
MQQIVHLALSPTGRVMAHFDLSSDAADYCERNYEYTHVPYNLNNRDKAPAPLVGSVYRA